MGLIGRLTGWFGAATGSSYLVDIGGSLGGTRSARENLPAVLRAVTLISGDVARISVRAVDSSGSETSPASMRILTHEANPFQSGCAWRQWMVSTSLLNGSAYSYVARDSNGEAIACYPLLPGRVNVAWLGWEPVYMLDGAKVDPHCIVHLMAGAGEDHNPYTCRSPLARCAGAFSLAILQERVATALCESGRVGKISITHPGTLSSAAKLDLLDGYTRKHISPEGASRPLVLDEGVRVERVGDGSLPGILDDRKFAIQEIARALGVPPQMLYQGDAGALSSQVEMQRQYVDGTISHWCDRFAAQLTLRLMPMGTRLSFHVHEIARGNLKDTAKAIKDLSGTSSLSVNDAREMLDLPPRIDGDSLTTSAIVAVATEEGDDAAG